MCTALHSTALRSNPLHFTPLYTTKLYHCTVRHYTPIYHSNISLHSTPPHFTPLHYMTALHSTLPLHCAPIHFTSYHSTPLYRCTTLHCIPLHPTSHHYITILHSTVPLHCAPIQPTSHHSTLYTRYPIVVRALDLAAQLFGRVHARAKVSCIKHITLHLKPLLALRSTISHSGNAVNRDARCCAPLGVLVLIARVHAIVICLSLDIQFQTLILIYISNFGLCCIT